MDLSDARQRLTGTVRHELRDHAFGDREVTWVRHTNDVSTGFQTIVIATGYFGGGTASVSIVDHISQQPSITFEGDDARSLLDCGELKVERNDETGPDTFQEGEIMPGLTKEGVLKEITTPPEEG
jgi:hypothetical protein